MNTIKVIAACAAFYWSIRAYSQNTGHLHNTATEPAMPAVKASPYAGEQTRDIKSLSTSDIAGLQDGAGMAYAKAAELNGYPGPTHVLELATPLRLSPEQLKASQQLMQQHKTKARELGALLVSAERALDTAFASKQIDVERVNDLTQRIGVLQATLRAEHLQTHLAQTALLNHQQITSYQALRGYDKPEGANPKHHH